MASSVLRIGDKVDIRVRRQAGKDSLAKPDIYPSKVLNTRENGSIEISVPMVDGEALTLPMNVRIEFWFYTSHGVYRCLAHIKDRNKKEGLYSFLIEPKSPLEKYQRRQFYRLECLMDLKYLPISKEEAGKGSVQEMVERHMQKNPGDSLRYGYAVDISGGGVRFISDHLGAAGDCLVIMLNLKIGDDNYLLDLVGNVVDCRQLDEVLGKRKYEYRIDFVIKGRAEQEIIVKYIFEQERINRQRMV